MRFPAWRWEGSSAGPLPWEGLPWRRSFLPWMKGNGRCTWPPRPKGRISPSTSLEAHLFNPDPGVYLPHRHPFLVLDRILSVEPGVSAVALQRRTADTHAHPPFMLVEAIAQLGGIAAAREDGGGGILAAIDHAEIHDVPKAGDTLTISVRIVKSFGPLHLVEGEVSADGKSVATATVTLKVVPLS